MKSIKFAPLAVTLGAFIVPAAAQTLEIGSSAPTLSVSDWIKGQPIDLAAAKGKHIIVVEFWATWCQSCLASIPHLTKLQHQYADKDVRIVGVTEHDPANTLQTVRKFVREWGDLMDYAVGFDATGRVYNSYMTAAEQDGIPTAFAIDKSGRIAWIGYPDDLDEVLAEMVAGTYDLELARKIARIDSRVQRFAMHGEWNKLVQAIDEIIALKPRSADRWLQKWLVQSSFLADREGAMQSLRRAFEVAAGAPDKTAELASQVLSETDRQGYNRIVVVALEKARHEAPQNRDVSMASFEALAAAGRRAEALALAPKTIELLKGDALRLNHFAGILSSPAHAKYGTDLAVNAIDLAIQAEPDQPQHYLSKFYILSTCRKDVVAATALGHKLIRVAVNDADFLNAFAWGLLNDEIYEGKYNQLALASAEAMYKADGGDGWSQLETLALAKFANGAVAEAAALQKQAIAKCDLDLARASLAEALARYEKAAR
ncbi:MAG: TlpA disulfide reductase family protein [Phycisphaerae bacterium]